MAEYALLVGVIGALCAVVLRTLGTSIRDLLLSFSP
jgi:Flp pilus assembly pilin Flp